MKRDFKQDNDWTPEDLAFKVVKQGTVGYSQMTKEVRVQGTYGQKSTLLYDSIALKYNQCEPGDLFVVVLPNNPSASNMRKNLKSRGLAEDDYRLFRPCYDEQGRQYLVRQRPFALQRLTNQQMTPLQPFPALAAKLAKEAESRGAHHDFRQVEKPVKPGPAKEISAGIEDVVHT